jgi:multidrug resistance efflux pump
VTENRGQSGEQAGRSPGGDGPLWVTLDLLALLNDNREFETAAMAFCNELAFHFRCTRVSLGWIQDDGVSVAATSHANKIEQRMEAVRDLERVLLEAADQDEELRWPEPEGSRSVTREHEGYCRKYGAAALLTVPLRLDGEVRAVVALQRESRAFAEVEVEALRLIGDLAARRLDDLRRHGRGWWRARSVKAQDWLAAFLGARHTWWKFGAIVGSALLLFLCFYPWPFRINGDFILKTEALINLPAPFDGFIEKVEVIPGDPVQQGKTLVTLDTRDLRLQEAEAVANMQRFRSEGQVAMGQSSVSEMHVAGARAAQVEAELKQLRHQLQRAALSSPFDGIVVEGALLEQIGAPVKKGDVLMKVTRIEDLYIQAMIPEADIEEIREGAAAEVAFASRPEFKFSVVVERIEPAAIPRDKQNVFYVRCRLDKTADWWRPGMTGVVKVSAGRRPPLYLMTRRLIDFIRLKFWL